MIALCAESSVLCDIRWIFLYEWLAVGSATDYLASGVGRILRIARNVPPRLLAALLCSSALHLLASTLIHPGSFVRNAPRVKITALLKRAPIVIPPGTASSDHKERLEEASTPTSKSDSSSEQATVADQEKEATKPFHLPIAGYYPSSELTDPPEPLGEVNPPGLGKYPEAGPGKIVLTLWISDSGSVVYALRESSTLPEAISNIIVAGFEQLKFKPGEISGRQVGTVLRIEIDYR